MVKFKALLVLIISGVISGCIQSETKPILTPAQLQTALLESETRIDEKWRNYCAGIIDNQKKQQSTLNEVKSSQSAVSQQLLTIDDKLDQEPEPVLMMASPKATESCPTVAPPSIDNKIILGRTEWLWLESVNRVFRARVDSGATTSSLSAHHIVEFERDGKKWVRFNMVPDDDVDDSYEVEAPLVRFARIRQASSEEIDRRPVVELTIKIGEFTDTAEFTLTNRTSMTYPILLGREFLRDIALIDVAKSYYQPKPEPLKDRPESAPDSDEDTDN
ncbi:MAG: ATP-dependent zinc protease [Methylophaga sp.]|nr:ATP-dependent zinc protease [Methylophaga sp.]